jgi:hypothetical protein
VRLWWLVRYYMYIPPYCCWRRSVFAKATRTTCTRLLLLLLFLLLGRPRPSGHSATHSRSQGCSLVVNNTLQATKEHLLKRIEKDGLMMQQKEKRYATRSCLGARPSLATIHIHRSDTASIHRMERVWVAIVVCHHEGINQQYGGNAWVLLGALLFFTPVDDCGVRTIDLLIQTVYLHVSQSWLVQ